MKLARLTIIAVLALSGTLQAQQVPAPPASEHVLKDGAEILSDTMGVDFGPYMHRLHADIQRNWEPLIPAKVQKPELKRGVVGIRFTILPNGRIGSMKLETTSGDIDLDKAAWFAITSEGQYPPLPVEFHGPLLELRVGFFYNTPVSQPKSSQNRVVPPGPAP